MTFVQKMQGVVSSLHLPTLLIIGFSILLAFYIGRSMKWIKLPSLIGFMFLGVIIGPSLFNLFSIDVQSNLSFVTELALSFVALSIGLELKFSELKKQGIGMIYIILLESFGAFILVFGALYLLTDNLTLSLLFGAIAPASAPAGTVAVIQQYKARGKLTKALYAVVGFDDGLCIIIFGFVFAIVRSILVNQTGGASEDFFKLIWPPIREILLSIGIGSVIGFLFIYLARKLKHASDVLIILFGIVILTTGLCQVFHLSIILTNMIIGILIINTQPRDLIQKIHDQLLHVMPLFFLLFFTLAGANLHVSAIPALGLIGVVYILSRSGGLVFGSRLGAILGKSDSNLKKYLGLGILSQAGVAIGLSLIVKHEFKGMGKVVEVVNGVSQTTGDQLGAIIITVITATSIVFEIVGPILTKVALTKAGEINSH